MTRIKGKFKGTAIRKNRIIRLSDPTWEALKEAADVIGVSRGDILEFWMALFTNNEEQMQIIAASENMTVDELMNRLIQMSPENLKQLRANTPKQEFRIPQIDPKASEEK